MGHASYSEFFGNIRMILLKVKAYLTRQQKLRHHHNRNFNRAFRTRDSVSAYPRLVQDDNSRIKKSKHVIARFSLSFAVLLNYKRALKSHLFNPKTCSDKQAITPARPLNPLSDQPNSLYDSSSAPLQPSTILYRKKTPQTSFRKKSHIGHF
jgi:hypothetical protein